MSSKKIKFIIILQLICLLVIIGFQIKWISNAYQLRKEQFDNSAIEAMNKAVDKLGKREVVTFISSSIDSNGLINRIITENIDNFTDTLIQSLKFFDVSEKENEKSANDNVKIIFNKDCYAIKIKEDSLTKKRKTKTVVKFADNKRNKQSTIDIKEKDNFLKIVDQMVMEYTNRNVSVYQRVDKADLKKLLNTEFKERKINMLIVFYT